MAKARLPTCAQTLVMQFAKWPRPGKVKTRLARHLGDDRALEVHCALTLQVRRALRQTPFVDSELWWDQAPGDAFSLPPGMAQDWQCMMTEPAAVFAVQQGEGLGPRMQHALQSGLRRYGRAMVVGSDCPTVDAVYLQQASAALDHHDLVLIPAQDGGYVLIGARAQAAAALELLSAGIPWGTPQVLAATLAQVKRQGLSARLLATTWDVDELPDYERWLAAHAPAYFLR